MQESEGLFCRRATYKGKYGKVKEAVKSARAGLLPQKGDVRKSRKERDQGRQEGGSSEGNVLCPKPRILFFGSRVLGRDPSWLKYRLLRYFFTRKPCAKEVPETDYLTQQKQYLKRTTLRRLKIPLRSICSKEGPHYCLSKAWARKLTSDKRQSTFIHEFEIPLVIPYLGYTA